MSINNVENLLAALRRVRLLAPEQVDEIDRELGPLYKNPRTLADYLVQIDWLTSFQVKTLFDGDWDELIIGPFILLSRLGEGGLSQVYKAWDTQKGRIVAVKVLRQNLAAQDTAVRQFQREMQTVAMLAHPNVIKTFEAYEDSNRHYFAMEFVEGTDLDKFVKLSGPLPVEQACDFIRQVATGLQHAHQLGLIHRDIKPANLFLINPPVQGKQLTPGVTPPRRNGDPTVKILDWGLARVRCEEADIDTTPSITDSFATEKGLLIGTADYVSPEQTFDPTRIDIRSDIYSLGCTFFYFLTGEAPFGSLPLMQKILAHRESAPPSVRDLRPDVPVEVEQVVMKMMAKSPQDRFQIPLLLVAPLRHLCAGSSALLGGLIRPPSSMNLQRPPSAMNLARPSSVLNLTRPRSSGSINVDAPANGDNGK
jgi:serine/threonine protein kinase